MAGRRKKNGVESIIRDAVEAVLADVIPQLEAAIEERVVDRVAKDMADFVRSSKQRKTSSDIVPGKRKKLCIFPDCENGGAPRWGMFCREHKDLTVAEKLEIRKKRSAAA